MSEIQSKFSEKGRPMSAVAEASMLVKEIAEPRLAGESIKAMIRRAARDVGFQFSRTKDLWYEDARRIYAEEIDALRAAARERRKEIQEADATSAVVAIERMVALRAALATIDPQFHRETIAQLDRALRGMGREVGAVVLRENRQVATGPRPGA